LTTSTACIVAVGDARRSIVAEFGSVTATRMSRLAWNLGDGPERLS
jgi:hypothetical protein